MRVHSFGDNTTHWVPQQKATAGLLGKWLLLVASITLLGFCVGFGQLTTTAAGVAAASRSGNVGTFILTMPHGFMASTSSLPLLFFLWRGFLSLAVSPLPLSLPGAMVEIPCCSIQVHLTTKQQFVTLPPMENEHFLLACRVIVIGTFGMICNDNHWTGI